MSRLVIVGAFTALVGSCLDWDHFRDASCTPATTPDYCASIPPLATAPIIDGTLECGIPLQTFDPALYHATMGPLPASVAASFAVAWRPDGLYVFARLEGGRDDPALPTEGPYCGDDLEIFVDHDALYAMPPRYDTNDTKQFVIAAPQRTETSGSSAGVYADRVSAGVWPASQWVSRRSGSVVTFEALVTGRDLGLTEPWNAMASQHVGFDLVMTLGSGQSGDAGTCAHTLGHFVLRVLPGDGSCAQPSCTPLAFCTPILTQ